MTFTYDRLCHPLAIVGSDNQTDYVYSADGRKFRATHTQCTFKNGALDVCHYFIQDYQGNNRILIGTNKLVDQYSHYYPYGGLMGDISTNDPHSYKYGGKELDRDFGIDLFDFEARQYDAKVPGFTSIDPLAENTPGISPYAYCAGDPVNLVDPDGRCPIYDEKGNFLGTDENGLQGDYIVMNQDNFTQGMSNEDAVNFQISDVDEEVTQKIDGHYNELSNRPDWDGELTLSEANEWFRNGEPLFLDAAKVDLSNYVSLGDEEKYMREYTFNTLFDSKHGRFFGHLTFNRVPDDRVTIKQDTYDFDKKMEQICV